MSDRTVLASVLIVCLVAVGLAAMAGCRGRTPEDTSAVRAPDSAPQGAESGATTPVRRAATPPGGSPGAPPGIAAIRSGPVVYGMMCVETQDDPHTMRLGLFDYADHRGVMFGALPPPISVSKHGQVDGMDCRTATVNSGSGGRRLYRKHANTDEGNWVPEAGCEGQLIKTDKGWVERLDEVTLTYDTEGRLCKGEMKQSGGVHSYTFSGNEVTIEANTEVPSRFVMALDEGNRPTEMHMEMRDADAEKWAAKGQIAVFRQRQPLLRTSAGQAVRIKYQDGHIASVSTSAGSIGEPPD